MPQSEFENPITVIVLSHQSINSQKFVAIVSVILFIAVFRTNSNQTVIQTYNLTTFKSCSFDDASDNDTVQYNGGDMDFDKPLTIPVALTIKGPNYFFSDADDGVQCQQGMAFAIQVNTGLGLPPSLNQPPPPPYATPPDSDSAQTPPLTIPQTKDNGGFRTAANLRRDFFLIAVVPPLLLLLC